MARKARRAGEGRTRWGRFGIVAGAGVLGIGVLGAGVAQGALPISLAFSGIPFTLHADSLTGDGFVQYAFPDTLGAAAGAGGAQALNYGAGALINGPASGSKITNTANPGGGTSWYASDTVTQLKGNVQIAGLTQVICSTTPIPAGLVGHALRVHIAGSGTTTASDMTIQAPALTASSATFSNFLIGETASDAITAQGVSDPYGATSANPLLGASLAQSADHVNLQSVNQVGLGTEAGSFAISGLSLYAEFDTTC